MKESVLCYFSEYLEKQDVLCKLTENQKLHEYGYSEIHTVVAIYRLTEPNVTAISENLKIIKKLNANGLIEAYQRSDNKQKIFYTLTPKGQKLYEMHESRHELWEK